MYLVKDMWKSGMIAGVLGIGVSHTAFGICVLLKKNWTLPIIVLTPILQPLTYQLPVLFFPEAPSFTIDTTFLILTLIFVVVLFVYVNRSEQLKLYFAAKA